MRVKVAKTNAYEWRDVILPGVYELRITAQRTGEYLGHTPPAWGAPLTYKGVECFEYCELTVYRYHPKAVDNKIAFPVRVWFREVVTLNDEGKVNARWSRAPLQMLLKCTEAAALREAFPDELGGEHAAEEMDGRRIPEIEIVNGAAEPERALPPKPARFDDWIIDMQSAADEGTARLQRAWKDSSKEHREYLRLSDPAQWDTIKSRAKDHDPAPVVNGKPEPPPPREPGDEPVL
jgi:phage recombination protein Bet